MIEPLRYERLGPDAMSDWRAFIDRCPSATEEHLIDDAFPLPAGSESRLLAASVDGKLVSGAHLLIRREKLVPGCVVRIAGGCLYERVQNADELDGLLDAVEAEVKSESPIFIEWSLRLPRVIGKAEVAENRFISEWMARRKLDPRPDTDATFRVDLTGTEEALAERMHKNFRRDFRKAERDGVTVRPVGPEAIDLFYDMSEAMERIKSLKGTSYRLASRETFSAFVGGLLKANAAVLFAASWKDAIRNMALVTMMGTPRYKYGATGSEARGDDRPPPTGQLLHWEIMRYLRERGHMAYDLGGTPGRELTPEHPNYGVWQFKSRMGGEYVEFFTRSRLVCRPLLMSLYKKVRG